MLSGQVTVDLLQRKEVEDLKKRKWTAFILILTALSVLAGCRHKRRTPEDIVNADGENKQLNSSGITPDKKITRLEDSLSVIRYEGDYGFNDFLFQGGAASDEDVVKYVSGQLTSDIPELIFGGKSFGCSTLSVKNSGKGYLFGRNFDWNSCDALIISSRPGKGYASVSTVNTDFIKAGGVNISKLPDAAQAVIGLYAPLDGMNERGLAVSVNMIEDSDTIEQNTEKPDLTTTTAIRLLLDKAADVDEALELLGQYDLHASMGMMVHFALADAEGRSVAVEYVDNKMTVTETPAVTNFYLTEGKKHGVGTSQSHTRYDLLMEAVSKKEKMTEAEVRDALDSVSKDNFDEFESTEWSIVMNQDTKELTYFHRENYKNGYTISVD